MTADLIERLRAGLDNATKGPWRWENSIYEHMAAEIVGARGIAQLWESPRAIADAAHIANCSPENIRILLDALAAMRKALQDITDYPDRWPVVPGHHPTGPLHGFRTVQNIAARALSSQADGDAK